MTIPPVEFAIMALAFALASGVAVYLAGRHNLKHIEFAFVVKEVEGTDVEQLDLIEALERRDAVLDAVADNNAGWLQAAADAMAQVPDGTEDTGEGFRRRLLDLGVKAPRHANSWGALTMVLTKRRVLVATGEYRPMLEARSHGRRTAVYIKQTPEAA